MKNYNKISTYTDITVQPIVEDSEVEISDPVYDRLRVDETFDCEVENENLKASLLNVEMQEATPVAKANEDRVGNYYVSVNIQRLNVRKSPNINSEVIRVAKIGDTLLLDTYVGEWAKVYTNPTGDHGTHGFVMKKFIK